MKPRRFDDRGVSTVVSAVLVFALILMVLGVYMSTIIPDQVAASEARHMRRVSGSLGDISAEIGTNVNLDREGEFAVPVELGTTHLSSLAFFQSAGTVTMEPDAFFENFLCEAPRVIARDNHASPGATFAALGGPDIDFASLHVLELKIEAYTFAPGTDDTASLIVSAGGNAVATLVVTLVGDAEAIKVTTYDAASQVVVDQYVQTTLGATLDRYTFDALDSRWGFASLIGDSEGPFELLTSTSTTAIEFYAGYWNEDGTFAAEGDGRDLPFGFQRTLNPSALVFRSSNAQFLQQTYAIEGGAVVLSQDNGQVLEGPPFSIVSEGGRNLLRLTLLNMTGEGQVAGSHRATVTTAISQPTLSILECSPASILVSSTYNDAWLLAWQQALRDAGLAETAATINGSTLQVQLAGTWTVVLQEAHVDIRIS
ncbi:MAG TPA: hypothetical protein VI818_03615 [Candidatus Thermoplasmatota archaeon]|nr:hypothetical protein [Candidatus Thermoplasmatota archaeon]